jgi:hypothetical protein
MLKRNSLGKNSGNSGNFLGQKRESFGGNFGGDLRKKSFFGLEVSGREKVGREAKLNI